MLTTSAAQRGNTEGATQGQVHYAFLSLIFANSASLHLQVGRENRENREKKRERREGKTEKEKRERENTPVGVQYVQYVQ